MRCDTGINHVRGADTRTGESKIHPKLAWEPRQEIASTDIGKESDPRFRHGEERVLAGHAVRTVDGNAYAPAHRDAIDQGDIGFGKMLHGSVQPIFGGEKRRRGAVVLPARFVDGSQIAARTEGAPG